MVSFITLDYIKSNAEFLSFILSIILALVGFASYFWTKYFEIKTREEENFIDLTDRFNTTWGNIQRIIRIKKKCRELLFKDIDEIEGCEELKIEIHSLIEHFAISYIITANKPISPFKSIYYDRVKHTMKYKLISSAFHKYAKNYKKDFREYVLSIYRETLPFASGVEAGIQKKELINE
jgi:hypothetical protein